MDKQQPQGTASNQSLSNENDLKFLQIRLLWLLQKGDQAYLSNLQGRNFIIQAITEAIYMFDERLKKPNTILAQLNSKITEFDAVDVFKISEMNETEKFDKVSKAIGANILDVVQDMQDEINQNGPKSISNLKNMVNNL